MPDCLWAASQSCSCCCHSDAVVGGPAGKVALSWSYVAVTRPSGRVLPTASNDAMIGLVELCKR